jgi:dihydroorotase
MLLKIPAFVDVHAHLRDPGYTYKEDVESGAKAAFAGGFAAVVAMPNTNPVIDSPELLNAANERIASVVSVPVDVYQAAAATKGQLGRELTDFAALKAAGAIALSDDGQPILDAKVMFDALQAARDVGLPLMTHSEDSRLRVHGKVAEEYMVARDLELAATANSPLHIQHVTTTRAAALIREAKKSGVRVTCETCPHYFTFTADEKAHSGALAKVFPPLRTAADIEAIFDALLDGTIDIIATDHAPHSREEKLRSWDDAPGGMIGLETAFAATFSAFYLTKRLTLEQTLNLIRDKMSVNPAKLLGLTLPPEHAFITVDTDAVWTVSAEQLHSKSSNSLWLGKTLTGWVV